MKIILSALLLALALPQVAQAKTKILVTETQTNCGKHRPPLDQTATGGIMPSAGLTAKADANQLRQPYPPALDLHF